MFTPCMAACNVQITWSHAKFHLTHSTVRFVSVRFAFSRMTDTTSNISSTCEQLSKPAILLTMNVSLSSEMHFTSFHHIVQPKTTLHDCILNHILDNPGT
jgi:hypothetical protein